MRYWVANTDRDWMSFLAGQDHIDEVNFWQPNSVRPVTLIAGAPWLFKLHVRDGGWIVGGAFFAHWTTLTLRLAWDAFGRANGASTLDAFIASVSRYSQRVLDPLTTSVGSSVLVEPFFLPRDRWVRPPSDWSANLTRGKTYDTDLGEGHRVWEDVQLAVAAQPIASLPKSGEVRTPYGSPVLMQPRLGQGAFRVMVTDAYERRCAVTGERTLPVLEAAHIKPYNLVQTHEISNGLLLRSDLHTLFDLGYLTVAPGDLRIRISRRIHDEFENGRDYYALDGREIRAPRAPFPPPSPEMLEWHADTVFRT